MRVRAMRQADLDAVQAIAAAVFDPPWAREQFAIELERPFALCLVAEGSAEPGVLAYVIAWVLAGELEVLAVATHPRHQRAGHARRLVAAVLDTARAQGASQGFLEVRADNAAAIALYESLGFRKDGRRARYYADGADAEIMVWQAAT